MSTFDSKVADMKNSVKVCRYYYLLFIIIYFFLYVFRTEVTLKLHAPAILSNLIYNPIIKVFLSFKLLHNFMIFDLFFWMFLFFRFCIILFLSSSICRISVAICDYKGKIFSFLFYSFDLGEWLHIDIAGPSYQNERATGYGTALLYQITKDFETSK